VNPPPRQPRRSKSMQRALDLVREFHEGRLAAFVSDEEHREQGLDHLILERDRDQEIAHWALIDLDEEHVVEGYLRSVGSRRALKILTAVLAPPRTIVMGERTIYPLVLQRVDGITWILEALEMGTTGLAATVAICRVLPIDDRGPAAAPKSEATCVEVAPRLWWTGFAGVGDDLGTRYRRVGQEVCSFGPVAISSPEWNGLQIGQRYREGWYPGPPDEASTLSMIPSPNVNAGAHGLVLPDSAYTIYLKSGMDPQSQSAEAAGGHR
jgi:hypothetical protein